MTLAEVVENIKNPRRWMDPDALVTLTTQNPSLRGMTYGYVSEAALRPLLHTRFGITDAFKPDDHMRKLSKSDLTVTHNGRRYGIQVKSVQTNSIRQVGPARFECVLQNDVSDSRTIKLPDGSTVQTTCYMIGEYDILAVGLQPFAGRFEFAFKKNKDLTRTRWRKYTEYQKRYLLNTTERLTWPLGTDWSTDLLSLLADDDRGQPLAETRLELVTAEQAVRVVEAPGTGEQALVVEPSPDKPDDGF